jgi:energy-coupling factor transporter ATP-binding protein EcfA2
MRIRELYFNNYRSFRGERTISFVDPLSNLTRPVTVLAGSNGSGKTTILNAIEALLNFVVNPDEPSDFVREAWETGLVRLTLEVSPEELEADEGESGQKAPILLNIAVGKSDILPLASLAANWENFYGRLYPSGSGKPFKRFSSQVERLRKNILRMLEGQRSMQGGLIYFPYERQIQPMKGGALESAPEDRQWISHFLPSSAWKGSLEQLWVWQNYLDLEKGSQNRALLAPFVNQVEEILGNGRRITVQEGRVSVTAGWATGQENAPRVQLHQLPSGEQQILLLFGELARRRRQGAVIVVDEIENSLHPTLQRLAMWNLNRLAREWDAQVIVTTHSIEIINTVRGGAFINLDYPEKESDYPRSVAENSEGKA